MFFIVGVYGSNKRRVRATYLLFFYTLIGSVFFLLALIYLLTTFGTTDLLFLSLIELPEHVEKIL